MSRSALRLAIQRASRARHIPVDARLRAWARAVLAAHGEITVRYVAAAEGRRLNRAFRGRDSATNVLAFAYETGALPSGDIVICAPIVAREAREQGKDIEAHHAHLFVHGLLHLQGHDHEVAAQARRMEARERRILRELGFPDPYM